MATHWAGRDRWRREAFGPSPEKDWLPWDKGIDPPREPLWFAEYLWGVEPTPVEANTARFQLLFHQSESYTRWHKTYVLANYVAQPAMSQEGDVTAAVSGGGEGVVRVMHGRGVSP